MKAIITSIILLTTQLICAQVDYGTPLNEALPKKIKTLKVAIEVIHFPKINDPIKIDGNYYWKHATGILSKKGLVKIIEYGAYLFYNDKWNLRKTYSLRSLNKNFGTKKQVILQGQPYVWNNNFRIDSKLFGGWAMWYFIGETVTGETVCGYETIYTTANLLN